MQRKARPAYFPMADQVLNVQKIVPILSAPSNDTGVTVETPHPEYRKYTDTWRRIRDCMAGVDKIRHHGVTYLPQLTDQEPMEYQSYKRRAKFVNFTKATIEMLCGFIFKKDPKFTYPDDLELFMQDCTLGGKPFFQYCKDVVGDAVSVGRGGTLIDWSADEKRSYCAPYAVEQIINWKTVRLKGKMELALLVLQEDVPDPSSETIFSHEIVTQWRVYRLDQSTEEPLVYCDIYRRNEKGEVYKTETSMPTRRGDGLNRIPFVFHGAINTEPDIDPPPMADISDLNIKHYMISADLENGRHFCGLPTPYAICFDIEESENLRVGSSLVWTTSNEKAKCGYLEFGGTGLKALETAIVETEEQLAALGARMLEKQKADEAYQTVILRQSGQMAALIGTSEACSDSLTLVLQWAEWWNSTTKQPEDLVDDVEVEVNSDFIDIQLTRGQITEMWTTCMQGGISRQTFHEFLQKAEVIPSDRDLDDELALIEAAPPPGMPSFQAPSQPVQPVQGGKQTGQQGSDGAEGATANPKAGPKGAGLSTKTGQSLDALQSGGGGQQDRPTP